MRIKICCYIKSNYANTTNQGQLLFDKTQGIIKELLESNCRIIFDFSDIDQSTTAFMNIAIGKWFYLYDNELLLKLISFEKCKENVKSVIQIAISNAMILSRGDCVDV